MLDAKIVADLITAARGLLGLVVIWLGLTQGEAALPMVVLIMLLDCTGDLRRWRHRAPQPSSTPHMDR